VHFPVDDDCSPAAGVEKGAVDGSHGAWRPGHRREFRVTAGFSAASTGRSSRRGFERSAEIIATVQPDTWTVFTATGLPARAEHLSSFGLF
jgi:hypothetical protein